MALVRRTGITSDAIRRLIPALYGKPRIAALLASFEDEIQILEDTIFDVIDQRILDNATGPRLRTIARLVGQKDFGWSDDDLRTAVRARIRANRSNGRPLDIKQVLAFLAPGVATWITELEPATVRVDLLGPVDTIRDAIVDILSDTRRGGVKLIVNVPRTDTPFTWRGAGDPSDETLGWSAGGVDGGDWVDSIKA